MKKILLFIVSLFACSGAFAQSASAYDDLGNLVDPPGEEIRFQLYAWVRGGYEMGRKYYETYIRFDGTDVYFYNICPTAATDTWVKGSYIDAKTIRVLPQKYFTEMTDVGPYTTDLAMWHGKKVGYDQAGTQYDHYDFKVGTDDKGMMTLTCADKDDWLSVVDKVLQGIYDFSSELEYTQISDEGQSTDIVTEQPAGRRQRYSMMANFYDSESADFWADFGYKADVVWGDDGNVWFSTLTPDNTESYGWIKGEYDKDKGLITVNGNQCVGYIEDYEVFSYLTGYDWNSQKTTETPLYFQVDDKGWIYATDDAEEQYVSTYYRQADIYKGLSAINQYLTMMPVDEEPVTVPEGMKVLDYTLSYSEAWEEGVKERPIKIGFMKPEEIYCDVDAYDVYIQGLSEEIPDAWIKGELISDGYSASVYFPSRQLLASDDSNVYLYFYGGTYNAEEDFPAGTNNGFFMNFDFADGSMSSSQVASYKDADYMINVYAGEVYTNIQTLQIYNVKMTPASDAWASIHSVTTDSRSVSAPAYSLSGQRVQGHRKGILIKNGEKHLYN